MGGCLASLELDAVRFGMDSVNRTRDSGFRGFWLGEYQGSALIIVSLGATHWEADVLLCGFAGLKRSWMGRHFLGSEAVNELLL